MTLEDMVKQQKQQGKSIVEILQYLRERNMPVSYILVRKIYLEV